MKALKLTFGLAVLALGVASAASSYKIKVFGPVWIGSTELKAGEYKVEMMGDKAIFTMGKSTVEVPATFSANDRKYPSNALVTEGKQLVEIDLGGTSDKIVFASELHTALAK
jgi:hypothetical protein